MRVGGSRRWLLATCPVLLVMILLAMVRPLARRRSLAIVAAPAALSAAAPAVAAAESGEWSAGFPALSGSPIASEREYSSHCASGPAGGAWDGRGPEPGVAGACGGFDVELQRYTQEVQRTYAQHGRILLLYDEFKPIGLSQHWLKRQLGLWLGMALDRAVFFIHCDDSGRFPRLRPCADSFVYFDMERHFSVRGGASMAWTRGHARAAARGGAASKAVHLDYSNWSLAATEPLRSSRGLLALHLFYNLNGVQAVSKLLFSDDPRSEHARLLGASSAVLRSQACMLSCSGFAVTRPSPSLAALVAPIDAQLRAATMRVGLHVRTMAADAPRCFPDVAYDGPAALDAAFGNSDCMRTAFDHWRFKLVPLKEFRGNASQCPVSHLADATPLTGWLRCAARIRAAVAAADATASVGGAGSRLVRAGYTAVVLATDSPALHRFASQPGALSEEAAGGAGPGGRPAGSSRPDGETWPVRLLAFDGSAAIAHTHQRPRALNLSADEIRAVHARGAADWYLLTMADVILAPIESAFTESVCAARADKERCAILSPRTDFRGSRGPGACSLSACFPAINCATCQWRREYMGDVIIREKDRPPLLPSG
ncbi:hypothetical protein T492DRAFT_876460 [Pavlovales sp. CCMP2436]|nr:hypothetical protein T492DRAFT_876460 [Pavlovales sp. CCMP2436]